MGWLWHGLHRLLRARPCTAFSVALVLVLAAGSSVEALIQLGQWPPDFVTPHASLVITGPPTTPVTIHAAVLGAELTPGLYAVRDGARVRDLIELAGGPQANVDLTRVSVEVALTDGQSVYVPQVGDFHELAAAQSRDRAHPLTPHSTARSSLPPSPTAASMPFNSPLGAPAMQKRKETETTDRRYPMARHAAPPPRRCLVAQLP